MKKIAFVFSLLLLQACNSDVATQVTPEDELPPDYNLLSEAGSTYLFFDDNLKVYGGKVAIYLRPFEYVKPYDIVTIQLTSDQPGRFFIQNDTLYRGDKIKVKYADFQNFLLTFNYQTEIAGTHTILIQSAIRKVSKSSEISFTTLN